MQGGNSVRRTAVIVLLLAALAAVAVVPALLQRSAAVLAGLSDSLGQEMSRTLGSAVSIGRIEVMSFHTVVLHDTVITGDDGRPLLVAPQALVDFSVWALLRGEGPAASISRVVLSRPVAYIYRLSDGTWNFSQLTTRRAPGTMDFRGAVQVDDGTADVRDGPLVMQFAAIKGQADLRYSPAIAVDLTARQRDAALAVRGRVHSDDGTGLLRLTVRHGAAADYAAVWPQDAPVRLTAGQFDLTVIVRKTGQDLTYAGEAAVRDGTAVAAALPVPVTDITGRFAFSERDMFTTGATAALGGQSLTVRGRATLNTAVPVVDVYIASPSFDPAAALPGQTLPGDVRGRLAFNLHVTGPVDQPAVQGEIGLPAGTVAGYDVQNAHAVFSFVYPQLTVSSARATVAGGVVTASGQADWQYGLTFTAAVRAAGVHMDQLPLAGDWGGPVVDAGLTVAGQGSDPRAWSVWGTASFGPGTYQGWAYQGGDTGFYWHGGQLELDYLNVRAPHGNISAQGRVDGDGGIAATVVGNDLSLADLAAPWPAANAAGTARFQATVAGTLAAPVVDTQFVAADGSLLGQPFDSLTAAVHATPARIDIDQAILAHGAAHHTVYGSIMPAADPGLQLTIASRQARAEDLVALWAPGQDLTGNVDNDITITGTVRQPVATGHLTLTDGSWHGRLISKATGAYQVEGSAVTLSAGTIDIPGATIAVTGQCDGGALALNFTAPAVDLARLGLPLPLELGGTASLSGQVGGTLAAPLVDAAITAPRLTVNGQDITAVDGHVQYQDGTVVLPDFRFRQGNGAYALHAAFGPAPDSPLSGGVAVEDGPLAALLAMFKAPLAADVSGTLNGHITLSGTTANPGIAVVGELTDGRVKGFPVQHADLDVQLANNVVTINRLQVQQGAGVLAAKGTADLAGPLALEVGAQNIDAGLAAALAGMNVPVTGRLSFAAQVRGVAASPYVAASLQVDGGVIGGTALDNLYGLAVLDHGVININQVLLQKGPYRASAYGTIPLAALSAAGREQPLPGQTMDVKVRLDQADLSILPMVTNQVAWAAGETHGEVTIGGTMTAPVLSGSITVPRGTVKLAAMAEPIQNVAVDIQLNGDKIVISSVDGTLGSGTFHLAGSVGLSGLAVHDYDLALALHDPVLSHKYFQGPVSGNLTLTGLATRPRLAGQIALARDTIDIPLVEPSGATLPRANLDVTVSVGDRVRLYNPYLYDAIVTGQVKLAGSTTRPRFSGHVTAVRGTVSYLRTKFRLNEGAADFMPFNGWEPTLHVDAQTRLSQTTVFLKIDGLVSSMQLNLTSDPPLRQQEILTLLTLRSNYFNNQGGQSGRDNAMGRDEMVGLLDAGLQMRFLTEMESAFRQAFGVDEFRLIRGNEGNTDFWLLAPEPVNRDVYSVSVSKYVNDRLQLSYTQGINYHTYDAAFRYDLSRRLAVSGSVDEQNRAVLGVQARYRF